MPKYGDKAMNMYRTGQNCCNMVVSIFPGAELKAHYGCFLTTLMSLNTISH